jgi:hypothetical protein
MFVALFKASFGLVVLGLDLVVFWLGISRGDHADAAFAVAVEFAFSASAG